MKKHKSIIISFTGYFLTKFHSPIMERLSLKFGYRFPSSLMSISCSCKAINGFLEDVVILKDSNKTIIYLGLNLPYDVQYLY